MLGFVQEFICPGSLPALPPVAQTIKSGKKQKKKPRAMSNNEEILWTPATTLKPNRERANTESQIVISQQFLPPPCSKSKPWGQLPVLQNSFNHLQSEESKNPISINKWAKNNQIPNKVASFQDVQVEEKDSKDLDEALLLIAIMESMQNN